MSEIQILSNASSSLLASSYAGQGPDQSEYVYDMERSTVNKAINRLVTVTVNNAAFGKTHSVEIPSFGILNKLVVKTQFKVNNASVTAAQMGKIKKSLYSALFQECATRNKKRAHHGRQISHFTPQWQMHREGPAKSNTCHAATRKVTRNHSYTFLGCVMLIWILNLSLTWNS